MASIRTASREPGGVARRSVRNGQDPARRGPVRHVAGALDSPFVALFHGDGADQTHDRGLVQEDADNLDAALDRAVQPLDGIRNWYEDVGAEVSAATHRLWHMVRPSGTEAPGARMCGQADLIA